MGIPKFFRYITNKNPEIIRDTLVSIDNIFFDLNCLIHPCTHSVIHKYPQLVTSHNTLERTAKYLNIEFITEFEGKIYEEIANYMRSLISQTRPSKLIYISIDGVAPRAKMEQQRSRRYRSIIAKRWERSIRKKHNCQHITFDTNCITPGTIFMYKLSIFLQTFLKTLATEPGVQIIYDDSSIIGEGEHKILQYMKANTRDDINCIYGLDADLIMLALVSTCDKVFLLREAVHFGKVDMNQLLMFDAGLFKDKLFSHIQAAIFRKYSNIQCDVDETEPLDKEMVIRDYVCLCFLIGNDFLPNLPGLDINTKSLDLLLDIYTDIFSIRGKYLVNESYILNLIFFKQIMMLLYTQHTELLQKYQRHVDKFRPRLRYDSNMEKELEKLKFFPVFNKNNFLKLGGDDWDNLYHKYYFNIENRHKNALSINAICENYIEGIQWNLFYYMDTCASYSWYYKYRAAPTYKDIANFLIKRRYPAKFEDIRFTPFEQLSIVLPIQSSHLWCTSFQTACRNEECIQIQYPKNIRLDTLNNVYLHECEPILNDLSNEDIKEYFKHLTYTALESKLNEKGTVVIIE